MSQIQEKVSKKRVIFFGLSVLLGGFVSWLFQPWYHCSDRAIIVLVSVFSMLTGFLVAVMAIVANDKVIRGRTWKQDTFYLRQIKKEMERHTTTFYVYLTVLVFAFLSSVSGEWPSLAQKICEHALLFFATLGIIQSFRLPSILNRKHIFAIEQGIKEKKEREMKAKKSAISSRNTDRKD